ncbi:MAG TPA: hypothetical protein VFB45_08550 [Pseudolabrys sp.]|nr:hypothetical protein [Pseudolabrys sp.]
MRFVLSLVLFSCLLVLGIATSKPASAGEYYYDGGYRPSYDRSYSHSSCCYRRIVRYERVYNPYRSSYYGGYYRPRYSSYYGGYYDRPRYYSSYYARPRYYDEPRYYRPRYYESYIPPRRHYYDDEGYVGSYAAAYTTGGGDCVGHRVKVWDESGIGWRWGWSRGC